MRRLALILIAAGAAAALAGGWFVIAADAQRVQGSPQMSSDPAELDPFEQRVREYLLNNPEVIMEALQILQQRQRAAEAETLRRTITQRSEEIVNDPAAPVGGNPAGDVTLVEFFDYNCPYCRRVAPTMAELEEADPGLRIIYTGIPHLPASRHRLCAASAPQATLR